MEERIMAQTEAASAQFEAIMAQTEAASAQFEAMMDRRMEDLNRRLDEMMKSFKS